MNLERRQKYTGQGRTAIKSDVKIDINFDLTVLNFMCSYVLSENRNIRRSQLINLRNLIDIIDINIYMNDSEKMARISFLKKALEGRLLKNLKNPDLIMKYVNGGIIDDNFIDPNNFSVLTSEEIDWINETISESLKYSFIYNDIDRMIDVCARFKAADYKSRGSIVNEIETLIVEMQTKFRRVRAESASEQMFSLRDGAFEEIIRDTFEKVTNPSRKLVTGMQGINEMLGGGFESGRTYMLIGNTGSGKSLTLLNLAYQIKKYNKDYRPSDPTKRPVIVYLTMENTVVETIQRLFELSVGKGGFEQYTSPEDIINLLRTEGELYLTDDSPIDIIIKFKPNKSVDTGYLYTLTEDLEDEGYEVICLIQDHVKRIRSCYKNNDIRLELGDVVNEFKTFAILKDIPLISNTHVNRDGARIVDEGQKCNKSDLTRQLGKATIGESLLMLDNLDGAFIIGPEYDADGNKYMAFKRIKERYKCSERNYLCQPFITGNNIKLSEDYYMSVPIFKESLRRNINEGGSYNQADLINRKSIYNKIEDLDDIVAAKTGNVLDDDNLFNGARYRQNVSVPLNNNEEDDEEFGNILTIDSSTMPQRVSGIRSIPLNQIIEFIV